VGSVQHQSLASVAYRTVLFAFALLVTWTFARQITGLLLALLLAVILALLLAALADLLERRRVPRVVSVVGGVLVGAVAVAGLLALVIPALVSQARELAVALPAVVADLRAWLRETVGVEPSGEVGFSLSSSLWRLVDQPQLLVSAGTTTLQILAGLLLVVFSAIYMAINPRPLVAGLLALVRREHRVRARRVLRRLRVRWLGWLKGVVVDALVNGLLAFAALTLIGVDYAVVFAVLTGVLEVVPYLGPTLAAIPPVLVALADSPEKALLVLGVYIAIQQIEGHLLVPLVMAEAVKLHPALVAFGVVILGQLFGLLGVLVAVPILSAVVILVDELRVKPIERAVDTGRQTRLAQATVATPVPADPRASR